MSYFAGLLLTLCGIISLDSNYVPLFNGADYEVIIYNDVEIYLPVAELKDEVLENGVLHRFYSSGKIGVARLSELNGEDFMSFYEECLLDVVKNRTDFCSTELYKLFSAGIDHEQGGVNIGISEVDGSDIVFIKGKSKFMDDVEIYNYYFSRVGRLFELVVIMQP